MKIEMISELKMLMENNENSNAPYDMNDDKSVPQREDTRKKVLTLKDINRLKKIRNQKREELAQDSVFAPYLYGPDATAQEGGDMMPL